MVEAIKQRFTIRRIGLHGNSAANAMAAMWWRTAGPYALDSLLDLVVVVELPR